MAQEYDTMTKNVADVQEGSALARVQKMLYNHTQNLVAGGEGTNTCPEVRKCIFSLVTSQ
jgi:hypothetical protein